MRTLIYKRTHSGDPDSESGVFGNHDCMGSVKGWQYDAVIGIGGIGQNRCARASVVNSRGLGLDPIRSSTIPPKAQKSASDVR